MGKLIRFKRQAKAKDEAARALFPPFLSGSTDARPAAFRSDATLSEDRQLEAKTVRNRRGIVVALVLVFLGGTAAALFGDHGYLDVRRQRDRFDELKAVHAARQHRVEALRREIDTLDDDPAAIERIAREDLGYVAKDELVLLLPGEDPGEPSDLDGKAGSGIVPADRTP